MKTKQMKAFIKNYWIALLGSVVIIGMLIVDGWMVFSQCSLW